MACLRPAQFRCRKPVDRILLGGLAPLCEKAQPSRDKSEPSGALWLADDAVALLWVNSVGCARPSRFRSAHKTGTAREPAGTLRTGRDRTAEMIHR